VLEDVLGIKGSGVKDFNTLAGRGMQMMTGEMQSLKNTDQGWIYMENYAAG